jgi:hypothetical protein
MDRIYSVMENSSQLSKYLSSSDRLLGSLVNMLIIMLMQSGEKGKVNWIQHHDNDYFQDKPNANAFHEHSFTCHLSKQENMSACVHWRERKCLQVYRFQLEVDIGEHHMFLGLHSKWYPIPIGNRVLLEVGDMSLKRAVSLRKCTEYWGCPNMDTV